MKGYFKTDQDLGRLEAKIRRTEVHVGNAERQLQKTVAQLKMLRDGVEYLISQSKRNTI